MATSKTEIQNSALVKIGEATISSDAQTGKAPATLKRQYPIQRRYLIRRYRWNFAVRRISLAPEATPPAFGFDNKFLLPPLCLRVIGLYDPTEPLRNYTSTKDSFKVEGRLIHAQGTEIKIFYLEDITNTTLFDPMFDEALAWLLASDVAFDISAGTDVVKMARQGFLAAITDAKRADAIEGTPEVIEVSEWVDSRQQTRGPFRAGPIL